MAVTLTLPMLISTRQGATELLEHAEQDLDGQTVFVLGRALEAATPSFVDELVREVSSRHASELVLIGTPDEFDREVAASAERYEFKRFRRGAAVEVPVAS